MNVLRTPDDSTAVVRIMGEFDNFLSDPEISGTENPKLRLTYFDDTPPIHQASTSRSTNKNQWPSRGLGRSKSHSTSIGKQREKDVEMIKNRSKIAHLESQLNSVESSKKRARVEYEKDCGMHRTELSRRDEDVDDLRKNVQYALEQEKYAKEQLTDIKKEYEAYKNKAEKKVQNLHREKLKFASEIEETKEEASHKQVDLHNTLTRREAEKLILQNKFEEAESQLETCKRQINERGNQAAELEDLRSRARTSKHKIQELEEQLARQEEAACIALSMQSQLTNYRALEKENMKLQEDNRYYRETNENNLLLKEQTESLTGKLQRAGQRMKDMVQLEIENEELKKRIQKWELEDASGGKRMASPVELTQEIAKLQKSQVVLLEKQSELLSSSLINEAACEKASAELQTALKEGEILRESDARHKGLCQRLQRRLFLVTADRDGCRRILNAFDTSYSASYDPQLRQRLQEAETQLSSYHEHIETLEAELNQAKEQAATESLKWKKLDTELNDLKEKINKQPNVPHEDAGDLRAEMEKLKSENMQLQEKLEIYGLRKDQMHMQGYYDPFKTKVVHFSMNPTFVARQQKAEEVEKLRKENDVLRQKIRVLEDGKSSSGDSGSRDNLSPETGPSVLKQIQDVKVQLSASELRNQRLKEVFSKKIQEFREACYALTGYKIDVREKQYRLQSMYAERSNDDLLFECNSKGEMMLLRTDFSSQVEDHIQTYLQRMNSIPAFLSNVTLDLFGKQTIVIN